MTQIEASFHLYHLQYLLYKVINLGLLVIFWPFSYFLFPYSLSTAVHLSLKLNHSKEFYKKMMFFSLFTNKQQVICFKKVKEKLRLHTKSHSSSCFCHDFPTSHYLFFGGKILLIFFLSNFPKLTQLSMNLKLSKNEMREKKQEKSS